MRLINADALAEKKFQERECNGLGEGPAYRQGWNDAIDAVMDNEPSAQPEYKPVTAEDFAETMSKNTLYNFMAWHGKALALMKEQGFVICKKTM